MTVQKIIISSLLVAFLLSPSMTTTAATAAPSRRPRRSRLCLYTVVVAVALQGLVFFYYHVSIAHHYSNEAFHAPAAYSLEQFLSYYSSYKENRQKGGIIQQKTFIKNKSFDKLFNQLHSTGREEEALSMLVDTDKTNVNATTTRHKQVQSIPNWLKEYIIWHGEQRKHLSPSNWNTTSHKYLIMQCLHVDDRCGGTADRLKPIPTLLYLAHQYKRILLINWERPCQLEKFLQPPSTGIDWRVPEWMAPHLGVKPFGTTIRRIRHHAQVNGGKDVVVRSRYQSDNAGAHYYNKQHNRTGEATFEQIYHNVWHAIFEPVPPLQRIIDETMKNLSLVPGEYAAAHLRAVYGVKSRPTRVIRNWAVNAVNCASQLRPGGPIFFASDSKFAISVVDRYAAVHKYKIVSLQHEQEPLHLEKSNYTFRLASDYYATFVDLYMLGNSQCLSYNVGGFGTWGLLMGFNSSCGYQHAPMHFRNYNKCEWANATL